MTRKKDLKINDIADPFIYYDGKNYVYCGPFSKKGYIITNSEAKDYNIFTSRYYLPISLGILAFFFDVNIAVCVLIFIAFQIFMGVMFRRMVLNKLIVIENFEKPNKNDTIFDKVARRNSKKILMIPLMCCLILAVIIPINAINQDYEQALLYGNYVVSGIMVLLAIFLIICISKAKN